MLCMLPVLSYKVWNGNKLERVLPCMINANKMKVLLLLLLLLFIIIIIIIIIMTFPTVHDP